MTRLPTLRARKIIQALERVGFVLDRHTGSHLIFRNPGTHRVTCVPKHSKDVKRSLMKMILRQAGLGEDEFRKLL